MSGSLPVVTLEEMSKHTAKNDIWMAHDGTVYDVTKFLDEHPGGPEIMLEHAGKDMTQDFEDIGHSKSARSMLPKYAVGVLPAGVGARVGAGGKSSGGGSGSSTSGSGSSVIYFAVPVIVLVAALWWQFMKGGSA